MESLKTVIYFVRHGEVENLKDVWYGRLPGFGLSEKGKKQMALAAKFLRTKNITQIYSSPLLRTQQSAKILQDALQMPKIHLSNDLLEIKSSLDGSPASYVRSIDYDVFAKPGIQGETIDDILQRIQHFIAEVTTNNPGKNVVAVSHGDPIMIAKAYFEGLPMINASLRPGESYYIQRGEIYQLALQDGKIIMCKSVFRPQIEEV